MTYSESQSQQEVNDILSSIRQMISEEEVDGTSLPSKSEVAHEGQNKILDLTRLVQEDGSVIELPSKIETPPGDFEKQAVDFEETAQPTMSSDLTDAFQSEIALNSLKQENNMMKPSEEFDVNTFDYQTYKPDQDMSASQAQSPQSQTPATVERNSSPSVANNTYVSSDENNFLSDHTVQESAAAFAALSRATQNRFSPDNTNPPTVATVGDYTVDELMRELLRPLLKDWLDGHLPSLVKTLVLEQIEKVLQQPKTDKAA